MVADAALAELLRSAKTIAVVGLSDDAARASFGVSRYLQRNGYRILPVNPNVAEVHGERAWPSLEALPERPDVINVFRRSEHLAGLVEPAIASGARLFWTQLGVRDDEAAQRLEDAGLTVVQDRCLMIEHLRLLGG
ncbi:MAG: CoA-binding protein [Acidobacteria bacterium]|nr:CoA-binding protein [Acidobacteriota bacterium]